MTDWPNSLNASLEDLVTFLAQRQLGANRLRVPPSPLELAALQDALSRALRDPDVRDLLDARTRRSAVQQGPHSVPITPHPADSLPLPPAPPANPRTNIPLHAVPSWWEYQLILFPRQHRRLLPGYEDPFRLDTDVGWFEAKVTSRQGRAAPGDPSAGSYIKSVTPGELARWFHEHPELKQGDLFTLQVIQPMKRYELKRNH